MQMSLFQEVQAGVDIVEKSEYCMMFVWSAIRIVTQLK